MNEPVSFHVRVDDRGFTLCAHFTVRTAFRPAQGAAPAGIQSRRQANNSNRRVDLQGP